MKLMNLTLWKVSSKEKLLSLQFYPNNLTALGLKTVYTLTWV